MLQERDRTSTLPSYRTMVVTKGLCLNKFLSNALGEIELATYNHMRLRLCDARQIDSISGTLMSEERERITILQLYKI